LQKTFCAAEFFSQHFPRGIISQIFGFGLFQPGSRGRLNFFHILCGDTIQLEGITGHAEFVTRFEIKLPGNRKAMMSLKLGYGTTATHPVVAINGSHGKVMTFQPNLPGSNIELAGGSGSNNSLGLAYHRRGFWCRRRDRGAGCRW